MFISAPRTKITTTAAPQMVHTIPRPKNGLRRFDVIFVEGSVLDFSPKAVITLTKLMTLAARFSLIIVSLILTPPGHVRRVRTLR